MSSTWIARVVFVISIMLWSIATIREPLWIDELHSVWCIEGDWQDVLPRATVGNQSPLYFYCLKAYVSLFQLTTEAIGLEPHRWFIVSIRFSSAIGWGVLAWLMSGELFPTRMTVKADFRTLSPKTMALLAIGIVWLISDRIGTFYSNEVRPYVWVSAVSFLLLKKTIPTEGTSWAFVAMGCVAFYLHYTTLFVIFVSWMIRGGNRHLSKRTLLPSLAEGVGLALLMIPGLNHLKTLLKSSSQWAYFAGEYDLMTVLRVTPWFSWIAIMAFVLLLKFAFSRLRNKVSNVQTSAMSQGQGLVANGIALTACCMAACWLLVVGGWAPLMHSRYLMGIYPAIWVVGMGLLASLNQPRWIMVVGLAAMGTNGWLQGSWPLWGKGDFVAWQRSEDWIAATKVLQDNIQKGDLLFFAPMLIETVDQAAMESASELKRQYFSFALSATLPQLDSIAVEQIHSIHILSNSVGSWFSTIEHYRKELIGPSRQIWVLARTNQEWSGDDFSLHELSRVDTLYRAGNLTLWRLRLPL